MNSFAAEIHWIVLWEKVRLMDHYPCCAEFSQHSGRVNVPGKTGQDLLSCGRGDARRWTFLRCHLWRVWNTTVSLELKNNFHGLYRQLAKYFELFKAYPTWAGPQTKKCHNMSRFGSAVRHEAGKQTVLIDPSVCIQQKHFSASNVEQESASVYRYGQDNHVNPAQRNVGTFSLHPYLWSPLQ